jgi:hypothetical protein
VLIRNGVRAEREKDWLVGLVLLPSGPDSAKSNEIGSVGGVPAFDLEFEFEIHFPHIFTAAGESVCPVSSDARNDSVEPILPNFGRSAGPGPAPALLAFRLASTFDCTLSEPARLTPPRPAE